jgi:hypothetical protein
MRRLAICMMVVGAAGCGGGGDDPTPTTLRTTEANDDDATTSAPSTTVGATTTTVSDAIVPAWASADAFVTAIADASAGVAETNPNAVALVSPDVLSRSETDDPALGAFGWAITDGVLVGGVDELDDGAPTEVIATLLVAARADSAATTTMAAYLSVFGNADAVAQLGELLQAGESGTEFTVRTATVTLYGRLSGEMPNQQVVIAAFPTDRPELADLTVNAVTGLDT